MTSSNHPPGRPIPGGSGGYDPHDPHRGQAPHAQPTYGPPQYGQPPYGPPQQPYGQPPKKTNGGKIALIVTGCLLALCLVGGVLAVLTHDSSDDTDSGTAADSPTTAEQPADSPAAPPPAGDEGTGDGGSRDLTYQVTGSGTALISYIDGQFKGGQVTVPLPWSKVIKDGRGKSGLNFNALRTSEDEGPITCSILAGGKEIATETSSGAHTVVSCVVPPD